MSIKMEKSVYNKLFSARLFEFRSVQRKKLSIVFGLTLFFTAVELIGGFLSKSMALVSDAVHMFTDAFALGISLIAVTISRFPPCHHRTFGLYRAEILSAFVNGLLLLGAASWIVYEAISRLFSPQSIHSLPMMTIATLGLIVNGLGLVLLHGEKQKNLNVKSVFYHLASDTLSSMGVILGGIFIHYTGKTWMDSVISLGISGAIFLWAWHVLKESARILMEMSPEGITTDTIAKDLHQTFPEIGALSNVHFWTITPEIRVFSAHVKVRSEILLRKETSRLSKRIHRYLQRKYHVKESTLQML